MKTEIRNKINKSAINKAIAETREHLDDIKAGLDEDNNNSNCSSTCNSKTERTGLQGWIKTNKRWIELSIIIALYLTGSYSIASIMLLLYIVETM